MVQPTDSSISYVGQRSQTNLCAWIIVILIHFIGKMIWFSGWVYGVADHNVIQCRPRSFSFNINHPTWGGPSQTNGNGSWADYPWYGTKKFWFIEDNTIVGHPTGGGISGTIDTQHGGRWVARHNYFQNAIPSGHGTEGGAHRGQRERIL